MDNLESADDRIGHNIDRDSYFTEDGNMFLGSYLRNFMSEKSAIDMFGANYESTIISPKLMEALVIKNIKPPIRPIGIDFNTFAIDTECLKHSHFDCEIVAHMENMVDKFEWYVEMVNNTPFEWLCTELNCDLVIRHIPLIYDDDSFVLFHAQHLYDFLGHIMKMPYSAAIFGCCYADEIQLKL